MKTTKSKWRHLIGHRVEWDDVMDANRFNGTKVRSGFATEIRGKNILIDGDWKWIPQLTRLRLADSEPT